MIRILTTKRIIFLHSLMHSLTGVDLLSAFSGSVATMGNAGPGFSQASSMGNFNGIPAGGKFLLTINMFLGRPEIFSVFYLISILWKKVWFNGSWLTG